jgi:hypothetical protein
MAVSIERLLILTNGPWSGVSHFHMKAPVTAYRISRYEILHILVLGK